MEWRVALNRSNQCDENSACTHSKDHSHLIKSVYGSVTFENTAWLSSEHTVAGRNCSALFQPKSKKEDDAGACSVPAQTKKQNRDMQIIWKKQWNREQSAEQSERNKEENELTKRWNTKRPVFLVNVFAVPSFIHCFSILQWRVPKPFHFYFSFCCCLLCSFTFSSKVKLNTFTLF